MSSLSSRLESDFARLRTLAEELLDRQGEAAPPAQRVDLKHLLHELDVHRVELEMQNEELRAAQRALEESRDRYSLLYDFAPVGYVTVDSLGRVEAANLAAARMLETERGYLIGRPLVGYVAGEDKNLFVEHLRRCLAGEEPVIGEIRLVGARGRATPVQIATRPMEAGEGPLGYMAITDLTARKQAEEEVCRLNATLEQRVAERTAVAEHRTEQLRALAAELSQAEQNERRRLAQRLHDNLQQILYAARLALGGARRPAGDDAKTARALDRVEQLLNDALAESRWLTAELSPPVLYDGGLVPAFHRLARQFAEQHQLDVDVDAPDDLAPLDDVLRAFLFEAVRELLFNIVKHAHVDRAAVEVLQPSEDYVHVVVSDHGAGFDPQRLAEAEPTSGNFGLFSVGERLEALGGCLDIATSPGDGTRITLAAPRTLPSQLTRRLARAACAAEATAGQITAGMAAANGLRLLVVDDHQVLRQGLATMLGQQPDVHLVAEAASGEEALDLAPRILPDIVLMDLTMSGIDGIETTRRLKAQMPEVCVIALSMHEEADCAEALLAAGATTYLTKGGPFDTLMTAIRAAK